MSTVKGRIWLGPTDAETLFETGWQKLTEEDFEVLREGRVANADLVIDTIATKKLWTLDFAMMPQATLTALEALYVVGTSAALSLKVERHDDSVSTYSVKMRPLKRVRKWAMDAWYWATRLELEEV